MAIINEQENYIIIYNIIDNFFVFLFFDIKVVDVGDPNASKIRIRTSGSVKAIRKY